MNNPCPYCGRFKNAQDNLGFCIKAKCLQKYKKEQDSYKLMAFKEEQQNAKYFHRKTLISII